MLIDFFKFAETRAQANKSSNYKHSDSAYKEWQEIFPYIPSPEIFHPIARYFSRDEKPDQFLKSIGENIKLAESYIEDNENNILPGEVQRKITGYGLILNRVKNKIETTAKHHSLFNHLDEIIKLQNSIQFLLDKELKRVKSQSLPALSFEDLFGHLSDSQKNVFASQLTAIQLSQGCSIGCKECNVLALAKPRRHISWDALKKIADRWGEHLASNNALLYYASDPLDWEGQDEQGNSLNYLDVHKLFSKRMGYQPFVSTAIPRGKEELFLRLVQEPKINIRASLSKYNLNRIAQYLLKAGKIENTNRDNLIQYLKGLSPNLQLYFLDENSKKNPNTQDSGFTKAGKEYDYESQIFSIGCKNGSILTPDGPFVMFSANTTPFTPYGDIRFLAHSKTTSFPLYKSATTGIRSFREPLKVVNTDMQESQLEHYSDFQIAQGFSSNLIDFVIKRHAPGNASRSMFRLKNESQATVDKALKDIHQDYIKKGFDIEKDWDLFTKGSNKKQVALKLLNILNRNSTCPSNFIKLEYDNGTTVSIEPEAKKSQVTVDKDGREINPKQAQAYCRYLIKNPSSASVIMNMLIRKLQESATELSHDRLLDKIFCPFLAYRGEYVNENKLLTGFGIISLSFLALLDSNSTIVKDFLDKNKIPKKEEVERALLQYEKQIKDYL